MSPKFIVMTCFTIGSMIGSYAPTLFGIDAFSLTSLFLGSLGGIVGIYVGYKLAFD